MTEELNVFFGSSKVHHVETEESEEEPLAYVVSTNVAFDLSDIVFE